jgi:MerR family transcriptional regulator/heat shock protein HspR
VLIRDASLGLIGAIADGSEVGYEPAQIRRHGTIVCIQDDLGINLAGVQVILPLIDQLADVHRRVRDLADQPRETVELDDSSTAQESHD